MFDKYHVYQSKKWSIEKDSILNKMYVCQIIFNFYPTWIQFPFFDKLKETTYILQFKHMPTWWRVKPMQCEYKNLSTYSCGCHLYGEKIELQLVFSKFQGVSLQL